MLHHSALFKKGLLIPILLFLLAILAPRLDISPAQATNNIKTGCVITPDKLDGQGLNITGLGLNITGLGLNITGLGLSITGLGLNITGLGTTPEQIVADIINNPVTPAWLTALRPDVAGGTGYNGTQTAVLIVDDFSRPDGHGSEVRKVFDDLFRALDAADGANSSPYIRLENINIGDPQIGFQTVGIASAIQSRINTLAQQNFKHFVINMSFGVMPCDSTENVTLVDSESGRTLRVTKDFSYREFETRRNQVIAPSASKKAVIPILECVVKNSHHSYTAYFGYRSENPVSVSIPIGLHNFILPGAHNRGQPGTFGSGRQDFVFKVDFNGSPFAWILKGPDNKIRTATATSSPYQSCARLGITPPPPTQIGSIATQGFGLTQYITQTMGIPENFVDEYLEHLARSVEEDPIRGLRPLLRSLLQRSYTEDIDGNPNTIFAVIPIASSGNFRHMFGSAALAPAIFTESIATAATLGDFGSRWVLSQDGNLIAPGAGYPFAFDASGRPTRMGAGTSFAAPFVSMLSALWLTYPDACTFGNGLPPLTTASTPKTANATSRAGQTSALACAKPVALTADLALTKTDVNDPVNVGGDVSYTLTVTNLGPAVANNVVVTDTLPPGTTFKSASANQGTCTGATCNLGNVAPTQTVTINLVISAPTTTGTITNTASVTSTTPDTNNTNNNTAPVQTTIVSVQLQKVIPITECVTNFGNGVYRAYFGYDNPNSVAVTIPIGALNRFQPEPENRNQVTTFLPGRQIDAFFVDFDGTAIFWKLDESFALATIEHYMACADVAVTKLGPAEVTINQAYTYEIRINNPTPTAVNGIVLTDALPPGVVPIYVPPMCTVDSYNLVTCNVGEVTSGATTIVWIDVIANQPGQITNTAVITSLEGYRGNPNNNSASLTTNVIAAPASDTDLDGITDPVDNCSSIPNDDQTDTDGDGAGNACDGDDDYDEIADEVDNCPLFPNPDQADVNGNSIGDACEEIAIE